MSKSKLKDFTVGAHIHVWCDTHIKAESLQQAAEIAKGLAMDDFVTFTEGAYNDGRLNVIQVYDNDSAL